MAFKLLDNSYQTIDDLEEACIATVLDGESTDFECHFSGDYYDDCDEQPDPITFGIAHEDDKIYCKWKLSVVVTSMEQYIITKIIKLCDEKIPQCESPPSSPLTPTAPRMSDVVRREKVKGWRRALERDVHNARPKVIDLQRWATSHSQREGLDCVVVVREASGEVQNPIALAPAKLTLGCAFKDCKLRLVLRARDGEASWHLNANASYVSPDLHFAIDHAVE